MQAGGPHDYKSAVVGKTLDDCRLQLSGDNVFRYCAQDEMSSPAYTDEVAICLRTAAEIEAERLARKTLTMAIERESFVASWRNAFWNAQNCATSAMRQLAYAERLARGRAIHIAVLYAIIIGFAIGATAHFFYW